MWQGHACGHLEHPKYIHVPLYYPYSCYLSLFPILLADLLSQIVFSYKRIILPIWLLFAMNWKSLGKFPGRVALTICVIDDRNITTMFACISPLWNFKIVSDFTNYFRYYKWWWVFSQESDHFQASVKDSYSSY